MDYYRLNELPQTYAQCKVDTKKFQEWFIKTARERNIELDKYLTKAAAAANNSNNSKRKHSKFVKHKERGILVQDLVPIAEKIAQSGKPHEDTTGLLYLDSALTNRNDITVFFNLVGEGDKGHPFFNAKLRQVKSILGALGSLFRRERKQHDIPDEATTIILDYNDAEEWEDVSSDDEEDEILPMESQLPGPSQIHPEKAKDPITITLTAGEKALEQNFQVLCFLYDFNQVRDVVRSVWKNYKSRKIGIDNASLVTDLAMAIIRRNKDALVAELDESVEKGRSLWEILAELYAASYVPKDSNSAAQTYTDESPTPAALVLQERLCASALLQMKRYQDLKSAQTPGSETNKDPKVSPFMSFMLLFDELKEGKLDLPINDAFTEVMLTTTTGTEPWLIFGLQIVLDIQNIIRGSTTDVFKDVTEGLMRTAGLMRAHMEYEDDMWALGNKPEYMSVGETKFSNVFVNPVGHILRLMTQITQEDPEAHQKDGWTVSLFATMHPVLGGLALHHFQKLYNSCIINKIQWFMVSFTHLYNACRQVGGLSLLWPDLEYIIQNQGTKRMFVGDRPKDPHLFYNRLLLGMTVSARGVANDHVQRRKQTWCRMADKLLREKRGMEALYSLQQKIRDYYYGYSEDNRWIRLHNVFAFAFENKDTMDDLEMLDESTSESLKGQLEPFIRQLLPRRGKNRRKKIRVKAPSLSSEPYIYAHLLSKMANQLREYELHSNFDYLAFYRRAMTFIQDVRSEVLFDDTMELRRLELKQEDPSNFHLLCQLFNELRIDPKAKNVKAKGDELSKDVVALDRLQKISKAMEQLIMEEGREELSNAEKLIGR